MESLDLNTDMNQKANALDWCSCNPPHNNGQLHLASQNLIWKNGFNGKTAEYSYYYKCIHFLQ